MYETSLDKVLNYMKQYVENRFEHDSEPMLNYKDLELVLNYIDKQKEVLDKIKKYIEENKLPEIYYDIESLKPILKHYIDADKILELLEEIE